MTWRHFFREQHKLRFVSLFAWFALQNQNSPLISSFSQVRPKSCCPCRNRPVSTDDLSLCCQVITDNPSPLNHSPRWKVSEGPPVVPLLVFREGTFPLTLIISCHVTTSCFLVLNVIYCFAPPPPPKLESDLSERISVTIRACLLPPSSVCTSYHPPGAAEGGIARCCPHC